MGFQGMIDVVESTRSSSSAQEANSFTASLWRHRAVQGKHVHLVTGLFLYLQLNVGEIMLIYVIY